MPNKPLILVDGASFLFRAYHAIRQPLSTSTGQTTHAVFGAINMLRALLREREPERMAVVLDAGGRTFRDEIYADYKANRPPMPDDLRAQQEYIKRIIPALGVKLIIEPGVEADDVIGTLASQAARAGDDVLIISGDKDLAQLVGDHVEMLDTMKNAHYDRDGVVAKFGVPPKLMIDYLALVGDASDNIPGVPGVGPKTAVKWLNEFGSLDAIESRAAEIKGKVGEALRDNREQLALARRLVTLKCDVELAFAPHDLRVQSPDVEALRALYTELEFRSWLEQLDGGDGDDGGADDSAAAYQTITDAKTWAAWLAKLKKAKRIAIDTETTSRDAIQAELVGLSFCIGPGDAAYLPLQHRYAGAPAQLPAAAALDKLKPILENPKIALVAQNLKYDLHILRRHGIELRGATCDTMLLSYLLDAGNSRHDLGTLARKHLGRATIAFSDVAGSGKNQLTFDQVDIAHAARYAAEDADITWQLAEKLTPRVDGDKALRAIFRDIEMPLVEVLARIEANGVKVDAGMLTAQSAALAKRLSGIETQAFAAAGEEFNIASPKQIQELLYDRLGIPVLQRTPKGQPSTSESVLQQLAGEHELPRLILQHRGLAKLKSTYTDKLPELINPATGRIHTSYHQAVASTGRLSSSDPNLQNIPVRTEEGRLIREAFVSDDGHQLVSADYSQIELRIMAHLSEDDGLIAAFQHGLDVHSATAAEVFGIAVDAVDAEQRRRAKAINFGLIYGMSAFGLARQLGIEQRDARAYIDIYFERYPGVKEYMARTVDAAREHGHVETLYGRRLNLPEINSKNTPRRQYAERTAINAPMQGSAADLIKLAMLRVDAWLADSGARAKIILQVHDELVLEVADSEVKTVSRAVVEAMSTVAKLKVPLVVDTGAGRNWKEAH